MPGVPDKSPFRGQHRTPFSDKEAIVLQKIIQFGIRTLQRTLQHLHPSLLNCLRHRNTRREPNAQLQASASSARSP